MFLVKKIIPLSNFTVEYLYICSKNIKNMRSKTFLLFVLWLLCTIAMGQDAVLEGTPIGSKPSMRQAYPFDGNPSSTFYSDQASMSWVGLDLGKPYVITSIGYQPKNSTTSAKHMLLGVFEGANDPTFMDAVPLFLIDQQPAIEEITWQKIHVSRGFRYVRYVGPAEGHSECAELRFCGYEGEGDDSRFYQVTNLPTLSIHVKDNAIPTNKGEDFESNITITYENGTLIQQYPILTRVRGNFSATHENRPYRIKFNDGKSHHMFKDSPRDESPAKAKKWTLVNNYGDKTLIRNNIAFEVSRRVGLEYTPWCRNVDVLLNGEYRGCYQLTDWLGIDKNKIDIDEMTPEDNEGDALTGGYFFEMNGYAGSDPVNFRSNHSNPITVHSPDEKGITPEQLDYIKAHFNKMESRVYSTDYRNRETGYRSMLDLDSFLKYFLSCEFSGNTDMLWQVFMYKKRGDDHVYTGPVWDADLALENDHAVYPGNQREDWTYTIRCAGNWGNFVSRILSDAGAMDRLQTIWAELRDKEIFTSESIQQYVDSLRLLVDASQRLNFIRWPYLNQKIHNNPKVWGSWKAEVDNVRNYVGERVKWMDKKLHYNMLDMADGVYQITTPLELVSFSRLVNNGQTDAKAVLTADMDFSDYTATFYPIGSLDNVFTGTIDGQYHTLSNLHLEGEENVGLIGCLGLRASVSNLFLDATCSMKGQRYVGGLVGYAKGGAPNIKCCGSAATVEATVDFAGGLVGGAGSASVTFANCYNVGKVFAPEHVGGLIGWSEGRAKSTDCYSLDIALLLAKSSTETNSYSLPRDHADVSSGALCYRLNSQTKDPVWRQNVDMGRTMDSYPIPFGSHSYVYYVDGCYTNHNPWASGYRYYKLEITEVRSGNLIQFSEFDILDEAGNEIEDLEVYTATQSTISNEDWPNVADNETGTKFCSSFSQPAIFLFDAGSEVSLSGYRIYTANDTQSNSGRNPVSWKLYGSNIYTEDMNHSSWEVIDERNDDQTLGATNYTPYDFYVILSGIEELAEDEQSTFTKGLFDMQGRRVEKMQRGIYILDGKKILVR